MTKCPKEYKNLGLDSFGNKRKVTEEMLGQFCKNDAYLKEQINQIWDTTDPETRVWQNDIHANMLESYSITKGTTEVTDSYGNVSTKNCYSLSNNTSFSGSSDFKNLDPIDISKTTARIDTAEGCAEIPVNKGTSNNDATHNYGAWGTFQSNEYWYVGWNRANVYSPEEFRNNPNSSSIPSVCRGQKFVPTVTGRLRTLTLNLKGHADAEYPLIVEIYEYPKLSNTTPLASTEYRFSTTSQALVAINFESAPLLEKDKKYAFVLRSPLTSFEKAYAIGGWSNSCYTTVGSGDTYPEGDSFLSENNGYSWIGHGKHEDVPYHEGSEPPFDFGFQAVLEVTTTKYPINKEYEVDFKVQRMNPITYAKITPTQEIATGTTITWYISQNGKSWEILNDANNYSTTFATDNNPVSTYMFLKAVMKTTNESYTPKINYVSIHCDTLKALKGYLKTELFKPRTSPMLGASIWSNCYCPYKADANATVKVDLYRDMLVRDRFKVINLTSIIDYPIESEFVHDYYFEDRQNKIHPVAYEDITAQDITDSEAGIIASIRNTNSVEIIKEYTNKHYLDLTENECVLFINKLNAELVKVNTSELAKTFIKKYPLFVKHLRRHDIYLVGTNIIPLKNLSVYPVHYAYFRTEAGVLTPLTPDIDYVVNYTAKDYDLILNDVIYDREKNKVSSLTFLDPDETQVNTTENNTLFKLVAGDFEIEYNPVWVSDLQMRDFVKYDENNEVVKSKEGYTVYNGFKLDVMTENIYITKTNNIIDTVYNLKVQPLPALRRVLLNKDTDYELELYEDIDFTVDYDHKKLKLNYDNFSTGDIITVKYTPNLPDVGLGVAYRMNRTDSNNQAYILPNYFTTRT